MVDAQVKVVNNQLLKTAKNLIFPSYFDLQVNVLL